MTRTLTIANNVWSHQFSLCKGSVWKLSVEKASNSTKLDIVPRVPFMDAEFARQMLLNLPDVPTAWILMLFFRMDSVIAQQASISMPVKRAFAAVALPIRRSCRITCASVIANILMDV